MNYRASCIRIIQNGLEKNTFEDEDSLPTIALRDGGTTSTRTNGRQQTANWQPQTARP
jgi:hypothetical protein